jgi:hypothetical protein
VNAAMSMLREDRNSVLMSLLHARVSGPLVISSYRLRFGQCGRIGDFAVIEWPLALRGGSAGPLREFYR